MSKGRNRTEETEGILLDVYPKLFTLYDESSASTVSRRETCEAFISCPKVRRSACSSA